MTYLCALHHVTPATLIVIVVLCVIVLTKIKAGEEIFVNCGQSSLEIMLGLRKKTKYTNVDGHASIRTEVAAAFRDDQVPHFLRSCALSPLPWDQEQWYI